MSDYRITPSMITSTTLDNLNSDLSALQRTSDELSSGKTILEPSDNPYGASREIDLQSQLDGLNSYTQSAQDGISWETTASGAMSSISSVVAKVRELLVQAGNGTLNKADREHLGVEVTQLTESVKADANAKYGDEYVFSGTATGTPPYEQGSNDSYAGNTESVARQVGPGSSVTISTDISSLLGNGPESGDGKLLDVLRTISKHLEGGSPEDVEALESTDLKGLDQNYETLISLETKSGTAIDQFQSAIGGIESLQSTITAALSNTDSANIATTSIDFSNQQAAYTAALRAGATIVQESLLNFLQ